jgi:hypothetical protein
MLVKYNIASEITDGVSTNIKWVLPKTFELTPDHLYQFNSVAIAKGDPFTLTVNIDPLYTLRYLVINSNNSFTININESFELLTNTFTLDVGPSRTGFTNLTEIEEVLITNPTGFSGPVGAQFTNPNIIEVKYILVIEKR